MCADAPDTSGINQAAVDSAALGKEALQFYKDYVNQTAPDRQRAADTADQVAQTNLEAMKQQMALGKEYADYNRETFRPLEQKLVEEAQAYDTPERQQAAADQATADVRAAANRATGSTARTLGRMGYDPTVNATRMAVDMARQESGAATGARRNVEATGRAMRMDAASLGRGLPSAQATAIQTGVGAGAGATGAAGAGLGFQNNGAEMMRMGYGIGMQGLGQAGGLYGQQANIQGQYGGLDVGGLAQLGMAGAKMYQAGMFSDEKLKRRTGRMLPPDQALANIEALPVHEGWEYDPAKGGPDDGGQPHNGPMRSDVRRVMGESGAPGGPGGQTIDPITIQGNLIGAVQALARNQRRMQARIGA